MLKLGLRLLLACLIALRQNVWSTSATSKRTSLVVLAATATASCPCSKGIEKDKDKHSHGQVQHFHLPFLKHHSQLCERAHSRWSGKFCGHSCSFFRRPRRLYSRLQLWLLSRTPRASTLMETREQCWYLGQWHFQQNLMPWSSWRGILCNLWRCGNHRKLLKSNLMAGNLAIIASSVYAALGQRKHVMTSTHSLTCCAANTYGRWTLAFTVRYVIMYNMLQYNTKKWIPRFVSFLSNLCILLDRHDL